MDKSASDLTARERLLLKKMLRQEIDYFPIGKALCLPSTTEDQEDMIQQLSNRVEELEDGMEKLQSNMLEITNGINKGFEEVLDKVLSKLEEISPDRTKEALGEGDVGGVIKSS